MESWRTVWRQGFAPALSVSALAALRDGLRADDPLLTQGSSTTPPPLMCVQDWPIETGCAICYAGWKGGCLDRNDVGSAEEFFARACFEADQRLGEPAACRWFLNWFDDTSRTEVITELLPEVEAELARRFTPNHPDRAEERLAVDVRGAGTPRMDQSQPVSPETTMYPPHAFKSGDDAFTFERTGAIADIAVERLTVLRPMTINGIEQLIVHERATPLFTGLCYPTREAAVAALATWVRTKRQECEYTLGQLDALQADMESRGEYPELHPDSDTPTEDDDDLDEDDTETVPTGEPVGAAA